MRSALHDIRCSIKANPRRFVQSTNTNPRMFATLEGQLSGCMQSRSAHRISTTYFFSHAHAPLGESYFARNEFPEPVTETENLNLHVYVSERVITRREAFTTCLLLLSPSSLFFPLPPCRGMDRFKLELGVTCSRVRTCRSRSGLLGLA